MERLEKPYLATISKSVKHQGIGGKKIVIEREGTIKYAIDMPFDQMTIGLHNFIMRRDDIMTVNEDLKLYYGHVGTLGYFVAGDELVDGPTEVSWDEAYKYLQ